jgi:hypothetical protein
MISEFPIRKDMSKLDIRKFGLTAPVVIFFCSCAHTQHPKGYSMAQATGSPQTVVPATAPQALPLSRPRTTQDTPASSSRSIPSSNSVARQIQNGTLVRYEPGLIVVRPTVTSDLLQPISLTTDAIITSSVISKIAGQTKLRPQDFKVKANNGILSIRAKEESVEDAIALINLALSVADIRQIIYTMPTSV